MKICQLNSSTCQIEVCIFRVGEKPLYNSLNLCLNITITSCLFYSVAKTKYSLVNKFGIPILLPWTIFVLAIMAIIFLEKNLICKKRKTVIYFSDCWHLISLWCEHILSFFQVIIVFCCRKFTMIFSMPLWNKSLSWK